MKAQRDLSLVAVLICLLYAYIPACSASVRPANGDANQPASFEVVSIRESAAGTAPLLRPLLNGIHARGITLAELIQDAFDIPYPQQLKGLPNWGRTKRFDVEARVADADVERLRHLSSDQRVEALRSMERSLLVERFGLKSRLGTEKLPGYDLVLAKADRIPKTATPDPEFPNGVVREANHQLIGRNVSMQRLISYISVRLRCPVADLTNYTSKFDFTVPFGEIEEQDIPPPAFGGIQSPKQDTLFSNFTISLSQIGLKMVEDFLPIRTINVEGATLPSEN